MDDQYWPDRRISSQPIFYDQGEDAPSGKRLPNELAFDQCDELLIEGEDPMEVEPEILTVLLA